MHKNLIVQKLHSHKYLKTILYEKIYLFKDLRKIVRSKNKVSKLIDISEDNITARLSIRSKHKASLEGVKIYDLIVKKQDLLPFFIIGGKIYSESVFKQLIDAELANS